MPKKSSSQRWLREHFKDKYVKQAQQEGYRSRAVYKIQELQDKYTLFKKGMVIVDLGAAPGGWSQYVSRLVRPKGYVIALDILPMEPIEGVEFIHGDFQQDEVLQALEQRVAGAAIDWVISDIAPNFSGIEDVDVPRAFNLAELALEFALNHVAEQGGFLIKVFQGEGFDAFLKTVRQHFKQVIIRKPQASRGRSREIYLVARGRTNVCIP